MVQEISQGSFQPDRYNDVLTALIGTPEHPRRVERIRLRRYKSHIWEGVKRENISYCLHQ
jgi:hypothetical protein